MSVDHRINSIVKGEGAAAPTTVARTFSALSSANSNPAAE
jgi:hypothetical protein